MYPSLKRTVLALSIGFSFGASAADELNWDFLQRGSDVDVDAFHATASKYTPGRYLVDVELNGEFMGKRLLVISKEEEEELCVEESWLEEAKILINPEFYTEQRHPEKTCYALERQPDSHVEFDFSTQTLRFGLPQKGLLSQVALQEWDYGMPALRLDYNINGNVNDVNSSVYSSAGVMMNLGKWVGTTSVSVSDGSADISKASFSRALYDLKADVTVGKTFTGNSLVGGSSLVGLGLTSNSSMRPGDLGYTPVFSGIAQSDARVTLSQNGNTIYSEVVPPGPFEINNVDLLSSGDVLMSITENDGTTTTQRFPLTIVPNMLSPGELEYGVYTGLRDSSTEDLPGVFSAANLGYGFDLVTLRGSALLHAKYGAVGGELVSGLGEWGTLSLEGSLSHAEYDNDTTEQGAKGAIVYSKTFNSNTNLQVLGAHYTTEHYVEFSEFSPGREDNEVLDNRKEQYELSVSHNLSSTIRTNLSAWMNTFWDDHDVTSGLNVNLSSQFDSFNLSLGVSANRVNDDDEFSGSLSVSVPLSVFDREVSSFATVGVSQDSSTYNAGISSSITDKLDYSASVGWSDNFENDAYSLRSNYRGDRAQVSGQLTQNNGTTTGSASLSGSAIYLPTENDVIFTRNISDSIVIADVGDVEGVEFTSSPYPSNSDGHAVIPVSPYQTNNITLNGDTLPSEVELFDTSKKTLPTNRAVVYMPFESVEVRRYLFQVKDNKGEYIPMGTWATSKGGVPLGFTSQHGVLFVNSIDPLKGFSMGSCEVSDADIKEVTTLQTVVCVQ
ncbi:fimbria/pilus outer membrane usher protein [Vibrio cyclitrophicus]